MLVLVVDDSALMRKFISEMLSAEADIEVRTARDGADGLEKVRELHPDVITLDVEMPRMDGIGFLEVLMRERPTPVIMISSITAIGAQTTLECLHRGAIDFVTKPSGAISLDIRKLNEEIVAKVRAAAGAKLLTHGRARPVEKAGVLAASSRPPAMVPEGPSGQDARSPGAASRTKAGVKHSREFLVVAIASSTGGPAALQVFLPSIPADLNATYLLVQHMPVGFTRSLAERMDRLSALDVREACAGDTLERGRLLVAPGGKHMALDERGRVVLTEDPALWGVRPSADVMMGAVSALFQDRSIGVILTGMGRDGAMGARSIHQKGGYCLAQDEASSVVYGMPRAAFEAGGVDQIVPLREMAAALTRHILARTAPIEGGQRAA